MGSTFDFEGCITHGPWGGSTGYKWAYLPKLGSIQKMMITVRHYSVVDSIEFQSKCSNGTEAQSSSFGKGGHKVDQISIDGANEYLISISGTYGSQNGHVIVRSICFTTNLKRYGPYGENRTGTVFSHDVEGGVVVGFHGRASDYLNAIGVYVRPRLDPISTSEDNIIPDELCSSLCTMAISSDAGPCGASGGKSWDDGVFPAIKQIRVLVGVLNAIYSLQCEYQKGNGESVLSETHGGPDGSKVHVVNMDDKIEYLTSISGFYGRVKGCDGLEAAITSISFHTNKRTHGPYGEEMGAGYVHFSLTPVAGKIVGLHGRSNRFLSAIGVHVEYF